MAHQRRTSRPDYSWSNFGDVMEDQDLSSTSGILGTTAQTVLTSQTLIRTRGRVGVTLNATAVDERTMLLMGLVIMNGDAFTVGGTAPEIFTGVDDEASWIWQGSIYLDSGNEAAVNTNQLWGTVEVDNKAMRKLKPGQVIAFVFQTPPALTTDQGGTYDLIYYFHCLNQS